ncbi:MAG: beta-galactosidase [Victivallales bacterium]|nr:beta-galactosidase [Victivallales bacterium]
MKKHCLFTLLLLSSALFCQEAIDFLLPFSENGLTPMHKDIKTEVISENGIPTLHIMGRGANLEKATIVDVEMADFARFAGRKLSISYEYKLQDVPKPDVSYNGFKAMIRYEAGGKTFHGHASTPWGSCDWTKGSYNHDVKPNAVTGRMRFAIPGGHAWIRNVRLSSAGTVNQHVIASPMLGVAFSTIRAGQLLSKNPAIDMICFNGGFVCNTLNWKASEIKQLNFRMSATSPGYYELVFQCENNGKKHSSSIRGSVIPDGKLHTVMFPVGRNGDWQGTVKSLQICHLDGRRGNHLTLAEVRALEKENLIPDIEVQGGSPFEIDTLRPRGRYRLYWNETKAPKATLSFLDADYKAISKVEIQEGSKELVFQVPTLSMTAELNIAAQGTFQPGIELLELVEKKTQPTVWQGKWIWCQRASGPEDTIVWFKREFDLPEGEIEAAGICVTGDDGFVAYVNGNTIGWSGYWPIPKVFDFAKHLKPGRNSLEVRVRNVKQNGGMICDAFVLQNGKMLRLDSDEQWLLKIGVGETKPKVIDDKVTVLGDYRLSPWAGSLGYEFCGPAGLLELKKSSEKGLVATVKRAPVAPLDKLSFSLKTANDNRTYVLPISVKGNWSAGSEVSISYTMPSAPEGQLFLDDAYLKIVGDKPLATIKGKKVDNAKWTGSKIVNVGGRQKVASGKDIFNPLGIYVPGNYGRYPIKESWRILEAAQTGNRVLLLGISFEEFWKDENTFDFTEINKRFQLATELHPNAKIMLGLYCFMPAWWKDKHPDDWTLWSNGRSPEPYHVEKQALSSEKWLEDAKIGINALAKNMEKTQWAKAVFAISVAESRNSEWFWNTIDYWPGQLPGYSKSDYASFRRYLRTKYKSDAELAQAWKQNGVTFDTIKMPNFQQRLQSSFGQLMDPAKDKWIMDWFEYRNWSLGRAVISLCKSVKEAFGNDMLAGAYYGYYVEFCMPSRRSNQDVGHNYVVETARSPYVDFVRAPSKYGFRMTGDSDLCVNPQDTYTLRNKLVYVEQDFRSYRENGEKAFVWGRHSTVTESLGAMNRAFGMMLASGITQYWYDFGHWLDDIAQERIKEHTRCLNALPPVKGTTPKELCIVGSEQSIYYAKRDVQDTLYAVAYTQMMRRFSEAGIPYRQLLVEDLLEAGVVPPHRIYVMMPCLALSKEDRAALLARFQKEKATVVWLYAAGLYLPGQSPDVKNMESMLGMKFNMTMDKYDCKLKAEKLWSGQEWDCWRALSPAFYPASGYDEIIAKDNQGRPIVVSRKADGVQHYFSTLPELPNWLYRQIAKKAGVFVYDCGADDPAWIGNDVYFIQAKSTGERALQLPAGKQLRAIIGPMKGVIQSGEKWKVHAGQTYGFIVEQKN